MTGLMIYFKRAMIILYQFNFRSKHLCNGVIMATTNIKLKIKQLIPIFLNLIKVTLFFNIIN